MRVGGGDCPGLNAVLRAIVRKGERVHGDEIVGFLDPWDGVMERRTVPLTVESMRGMLPRGGRVMVVEVMGRNSGWIATYAGIAGGATVVLVPERPFDIDEVCQRILRRHQRGRFASIVVVAEGAVPEPDTIEIADGGTDRFGHARLGGIGQVVAQEIGDRTGFETRPVLLGHVQRGGTPTAFDPVLSTRFGVAAIDAVHRRAWGQMVALRADRIVDTPLSDVVGKTRHLDIDLSKASRRSSSRDGPTDPRFGSQLAGSAGNGGWAVCTKPG